MSKSAGAAAERVLSPLGEVRLSSDDAGHQLTLDVSGTTYQFRLLWAGEGFPEDVRRALTTADKRPDAQGVPLVVARRLSSGAQRLLAERGVSWLDESGAAYVVAPPGLLITRSPEPERSTPTTRQGWRWSRAAAQVAEVVLTDATHHRDTEGHLLLQRAEPLAERAQVSVSAVNGALRGWQSQGWVEKQGGQRGPRAQRLLVTPGDLLSSWAAWVASQPVREAGAHALLTDAVTWAREDLPSLMPAEPVWCLGGLVASEVQSPYATAVPRVLCHIRAEDFDRVTHEVLADSRVRAVDSGARLTLREAPASTVALAQGRTPPLASAPRVYTDLVAEGGRSEDVASHFRSVVCGF